MTVKTTKYKKGIIMQWPNRNDWLFLVAAILFFLMAVFEIARALLGLNGNPLLAASLFFMAILFFILAWMKLK